MPAPRSRAPSEAAPGRLQGMSDSTLRIVEAASPEELEAARLLFLDYAASLGWDLASGGRLAEEVGGLPGPYAPPAGSLLLAFVGDAPAGVLGLQPVPVEVRIAGMGADTAGELKRLFVCPAYRRRGVGHALMRRAEDEARARGYDALLLTTSAEMMPLAQHVYDALGYVETAPYRDDMPYPHIRWMRLAL